MNECSRNALLVFNGESGWWLRLTCSKSGEELFLVPVSGLETEPAPETPGPLDEKHTAHTLVAAHLDGEGVRLISQQLPELGYHWWTCTGVSGEVDRHDFWSPGSAFSLLRD